MDGKGHSDKVSDRNKKHVIENGKKSYCWYKVAKNLTKLFSCPSVLCKV